MLSRYKKTKGYHLTYTITDFYNTYEKEEIVTKKLFISFMVDFFLELRKEIVENKYKFKFPFRMGIMRIIKRKNTGILGRHKIDWKESVKKKETIYHLNLHTDRHYFQYRWERPRLKVLNFKNQLFYYFKPVRSAKRHMANHIKECATNPDVRDYDCLNK